MVYQIFKNYEEVISIMKIGYYFKLFFLALVVSSLYAWIIGLVFLNKITGWIWLLWIVLFVIRNWKRSSLELSKSFHNQMMILCFLSPLIFLIFGFVFTGKVSVETQGASSATQAGTVIGGMLGGGLLTVCGFVIGLPLGFLFMSLKNSAEQKLLSQASKT